MTLVEQQLQGTHALIEFLLVAEEPMAFLRCWNEGDFEACRKEWPEAPDAVYIGADTTHPETLPMLDIAPPPAPRSHDAFLESSQDLLAYVLQDDIHNRVTPRVIDIAYSAFMQAARPNPEDGKASDWFTDTRPMVQQAIDQLRADLSEDHARMDPDSRLGRHVRAWAARAGRADNSPEGVWEYAQRISYTQGIRDAKPLWARAYQEDDDGYNKRIESAIQTVSARIDALGTLSNGRLLTFEEAWAVYAARGFSYGEDALENVRFGWSIARATLALSPAGDARAVVQAAADSIKRPKGLTDRQWEFVKAGARLVLNRVNTAANGTEAPKEQQ